MHLDSLIQSLNDSGYLSQVLNPAEVKIQAADSYQVISDLVSSVLPGKSFLGEIEEGTGFPSLVFDPVESDRWGDEDFEMFRTDRFVITLYDEYLSGLVPKLEQLKQVLLSWQPVNEFGAIEVTNAIIGYEDEKKCRVGALEVDVTHFALPDQLCPAAFVYYNNVSAAESETLDVSRQRGRYSFNVTLVCLHQDLDVLRLNVKSVLGGFQIDGWPIGYSGGARVTNIGSYVVWRESYEYGAII